MDWLDGRRAPAGLAVLALLISAPAPAAALDSVEREPFVGQSIAGGGGGCDSSAKYDYDEDDTPEANAAPFSLTSSAAESGTCPHHQTPDPSDTYTISGSGSGSAEGQVTESATSLVVSGQTTGAGAWSQTQTYENSRGSGRGDGFVSMYFEVVQPVPYSITGAVGIDADDNDGATATVEVDLRLDGTIVPGTRAVITRVPDGMLQNVPTASQSGTLEPGPYEFRVFSYCNAQSRTFSEGGCGVNASGTLQLGSTPRACTDTDTNGTSDNDGDGLCDNWETDGIDEDGDGTIDLVLAGARRDQKDLYLEVDYMAGHRPHPAAIADVVAAFAAAPVPIALHIELDEELPHAAEINLAGCAGGANAGAADFDTIKAAAFGTAAQRAGPGLGAKAKKHSHRYAIFGHSRSNTTSSGCAETGGNDTLVTLGNFTAVGGHQVGTRDQQAGTLMHEFGHNLGFQHGGNEPVNCKPNYLSVMSYSRQFDTVPIIGRPLDYSRAQLAPLDETALNEPLGIGAPAGSQTAFGPEPLWVVASHGAIDWDLSGGAADPAAVADINQAISTGCGAGFSVLTGFDDWSNIVFDFQSLPSFADGVRDPGPVEITYEQARAISPDTDGDGVVNLDDNCVFEANADQADADGDGVGDRCAPAAPPTVTPTPTPTPQATSPACVDTSPPESRFRRVQLDRRVLRAQGTAADVGCGSAARVARIELALARRANGKCRFVTAKGRFQRARPCRSRSWLLKAKGTTTWKISMRFRPKLPRGRYVLLARGVDRAGNVETKLASRSGRLK